MIESRDTFEVPSNDKFFDSFGGMAQIWLRFFISIWERLKPLGVEKSFNFISDGTAKPVSGLQFSPRTENAIFVDFFIQRISLNQTPAAGQEKNEIGTLYIYFSPRAGIWRMTKVSGLSTTSSDVTFSINSATGQVSVSSASLTGNIKINKITWRARSFGARLMRQEGWDL